MINTQNKSKVFLLIIAILLITNIAMIVFFVMKKNTGRHGRFQERKEMIAQFLKKDIGFNVAQLQQFDSLSTKHRDAVKKMFEDLRSTKDKQFAQLATANFTDSVIEDVALQSAASQKMTEVKMFNHLRNIRLLCTPEQLPKFDSLFVKILNRKANGKQHAD